VAEGLAAAQNKVKSAMASVGVKYAVSVADLPLTVLELDEKQLKNLISSGLVEAVQEDVLDRAYLADSVPLIRAPEAWDGGARGQGQAVAVLDSGVEADHPFLGGRVVSEACFSSVSTALGATPLCPNGDTSQTGDGAATPCTIDGCDHGTHVAGIAAGSGTDASGVAPDASIIAIQVFSRFDDAAGGPQTCRDSGLASPCILTFRSDQIRALQHVDSLAGQNDIASVNMSLGGGRNTDACPAQDIDRQSGR
jgi:subtilisin family serine protease